MTLQVRQADVGDARAIAEVHVASWRVAYRGIIADDRLARLSVDARAEAWVALLRNTARPCLVALRDGAVAGFVHVAPCRDADKSRELTGELTSLYVSPAAWRQGVGSALLDAALAVCDRWQVAEVTLWVLERNAPARAFYQRLGFRADGSRKVHPGSGLVELRYALARKRL